MKQLYCMLRLREVGVVAHSVWLRHFMRRFIKLMKGKALRKHSLHEKTAASVFLKLFISGNE